MTEMLEIEGLRIPLDRNVITPKIEQSIQKGNYEKDERNGLPKFVEPGDRIIELGAGIGFISSFTAKTLGVNNIMCVEADPSLCEFIGRVHAENGIEGVEVRNMVGLNDSQPEGEMTFYVREQFWSSSLDGSDKYVKALKVPARRLSALIKEFKANTLIVDIEGGERDLFQNVDLTGVDKIFLEIHTRKIKRVGIKMVFDGLSEAGFCYDQQVSRGGSVLFRRIPERQLRQLQK